MNIRSIILEIKGMTCTNCRDRIERKLLASDGVRAARVSFEKNEAAVEYDEDRITISDMIASIRKIGYDASRKETGAGAHASGRLLIICAILVSYALLQHFGVLNKLVPARLADSGMSYAMLFAVGVLTSVHCIAMCGGINLSLCLPPVQSGEGTSFRRSTFFHSLQYNAGRVISYTTIGLILGGIGMFLTGAGSVAVPSFFQGILKILAGVFMVIAGINILGIFPWFRNIRISLPVSLTSRIYGKKKTAGRAFRIGLLNGLMPCGPLQSMQIIALGSGDPIAGAMSMFAFSLGTVPLMLGLGSVFSMIGKKYANAVVRLGAGLVVVLGLAMFTQGMSLTGAGSFMMHMESAPLEEQQNMAVLSEQGDMQYVKSTLDYGSYPAITVYSGIPVTWTIDAAEEVINGCNYQMILNEYGITHAFTPGENVIEFTPGAAGRVPYTCWMGMINGQIDIIDP